MQPYYFSKSQIHGQGAFAKRQFAPDEPIEAGIYFFLFFPIITKFGSMINHSYNPTCNLKWINGKWYVVANKILKPHEEITLDYRNTPWYIEGPREHYI